MTSTVQAAQEVLDAVPTTGERGDALRWLQSLYRAEPTDACCPCPYNVNNQQGYPRVRVHKRRYLMSRLILQWSTRPPEPGEFALHSCDNPPCCNPLHLRWGSVQDNTNDMRSRGRERHPKGEQHCHAVLTEERVRGIRAGSAAGKSPAVLALEYGVARRTVYNVLSRRSWKHVA